MCSPSALCKYRWAKIVDTDSSDIGFYPSYAPTEPVLLSWDSAFKAYLSPELRIDCGNYHGVLKVDGKPFGVEDFVVKSYTFEVDLFLKDDILEPKAPSPPTVEFRSSPANADCAHPTPTSTLSHSASAGQELPSRSETEATGTSRVGDILQTHLTPERDTDGEPTKTSGNLLSSARPEPLDKGHIWSNEDFLRSSSPQSLSVRRISPIGDDKGGDGSTCLTVGKSDCTDTTRMRGERPYSSGTDEANGINTASIAQISEARIEVASRLVDDIIGGKASIGKNEDVGSPARDSPKVNYGSREREIVTDHRDHGGNEQRSVGTSRSAQSVGEDRQSSRPLSSAGVEGRGFDYPSREEYAAPHSSVSTSGIGHEHSKQSAEGIYGRPPSRSNDRLSPSRTPDTELSSYGNIPDRRYQTNDGRTAGSTSCREGPRDFEIDHIYGHRERSHRSDGEGVGSRGGSRPPSVPGSQGSRPSSQPSDDRQRSYVDSEGRERSQQNRGSREGSYPGSQHSSRASSHASLTSEQELGQYLEREYRGNSGADRERVQRVTPLSDEAYLQGSSLERPASMPAYGTHSEPAADKRSITPDNRVRVPASSWSKSGGAGGSGARPALRSSLSTDRMGDPMGGRSSVASSDGRRTVTPGLGDREDSSEVDDLRNTVDNLRQLVSRRDSEIRSLRNDVQDLREARTPHKRDARTHESGERVQDSFEYKQLQSEKEILVTEMVTLKEEVRRLSSRNQSEHRSGEGGGGGGGGRSTAINDYSPYSPMVLQRKIADLEGQIHDLQEVNETTTSSLARTEEKVRLLQEENHDLRTRAGSNLEDSGEQHSLRVQMRTLREDIASLKERNFQLTEENIRLQESVGSRSTTGLTMQRSGSSLGLKSDDGPSKHVTSHSERVSSSSYLSRYAPPSLKTTGSGSHLDRTVSTAGYSSRLSREDLAPKDHNRHRGTSLGKTYDSDGQGSIDSKFQHQRNLLDSPRLRFNSSGGGSDVISHKPPNPTSSSGVSRNGMLPASASSFTERDRSRPDGEVSDHVHSDRYRPMTTRSSYESPQRDRDAPHESSTSRSHKPGSYSFRKDPGGTSGRDSLSDYRREDTYMAYLSDSKVDRHSKEDQLRRSSTGNSLGSKDNRYISGNLELDRYKPASSRDRAAEDDDDSDTATDILLAQDSAGPQISYRSGKSPGSDISGGANSSDEAAEDTGPGHTSLRRRCRSADPSGSSGRHGADSSWRNNIINSSSSSSYNLASSTTNINSSSTARNLPPHPSSSSSVAPPRGYNRSSAPAPYSSRTSSSEDQPDGAMQTVSASGHRSVLPKPLVTQHNKHELARNGASLLNSSLTQGLRPFAPRSPADIRVDDVVKFSRLGGKLTQGSVKYVGHLPGRSEVYLGVELDRDEGKHDGTFEDIRYFKCKPSKGVFVAFNKVVMAWAP